MIKSLARALALVLLAIGLPIVACVAIFHPFGVHLVSGWALLPFLIVVIGAFLWVLFTIVVAILRGMNA